MAVAPPRPPLHIVVHPHYQVIVRWARERHLTKQTVIPITCRDDLHRLRGYEFVHGYDEVHHLANLDDASYATVRDEIDQRFRRDIHFVASSARHR